MQNFIGFTTIFWKEIDRSRQVVLQAIVSPTLTTALYFIIFGAAIGSQISDIGNITYQQFIVPGLIMMALITNALMAASSGIYFPKFIGTITDILTAPLSALEITLGFTLAATVRALIIGILIFLVALIFTPVPIIHPWLVLLFGFLSAFIFALFGFIIGIWASDFEKLSLFPSLILTPLSFFGGVFYSAEMLPDPWHAILYINPLFYLIDGFRYGFFGISDTDPIISFAALLFFLLIYFCHKTPPRFLERGKCSFISTLPPPLAQAPAKEEPMTFSPWALFTDRHRANRNRSATPWFCAGDSK